MVALTLCDALVCQKAQCEIFPNTASMDEQPNPMGTTAKREGGPKKSTIAPGSGPVGLKVDEE